MDLEDGSSGSRVDEDRELEKPMKSDETSLEIKGSCVILGSEHVENSKTSNKSNGSSCVGETIIKNDGEEKDIDNKPREISPSTVGSPSDGSEGLKKGQGLKKWRRRTRKFVRDGDSPQDSNLGLKRVLPTTEQAKITTHISNSQKWSEGSIGTKNSMSNLGVSPVSSSSLPIQISDTESRFAIGSYFLVGTDSENSEDRSSKSSTAASVPKIRTGSKHNTSKGSGNVVHMGSQGKGTIDITKKLRGQKVNNSRRKIEKEMVLENHVEDECSSKIEDDSNNHVNSYSSVESDLRSSVGTVNGSHIETERHNRCSNYAGEAQVGEGGQAGYYNENGGEAEDGLRENDNGYVLGSTCQIGFHCDQRSGCGKEKEKAAEQPEGENHQPRTENDPLVHSLIQLQAAQIALEKEIQKFGEMGNETISQPANSSHGPSSPGKFGGDSSTVPKSNLYFPSHSEEMEGTGFSPVEIELIKLRQRVNLLEHELEEESNTVMSEEAKVLIEAILNETYSPKTETEGNNLRSLQDNREEMEIELESLLKEKLEAEIECLIITRATQNWKVSIEDQVSLFEELSSVAMDQGQMEIKLKETEKSVLLLKSHTEELEIACKELRGTEEVLKAHNKVCKYSLCFLVQFILLCVAIGLLLFQLFPHSPGVVPT